MKSLPRTLLWLLALGTAVAVAAVLAIRNTRPAPPNLEDDDTWILVKKDLHGDADVRVYVVERLSTTWDPHDVAQNKIVIRSRATEHQFRWPYDRDFAGGWCEIIHGPNGSVAVVLFGNENVVRVVTFIDGRFVFRPNKDQLAAARELTYKATKPGELMFEVREAERAVDANAWRWMPDTGFRKVTHRE